MLYLRSKVLAEARAAKLPIVIEGPYADHKDADGLVSECRAARQLGYGGKAAIHPIQIDIINREFSPTKDELAYYRRVVAEMEGALSRGVGAIALDGVLVDQAMLFMARQVLESAEQCQGHEGTSSG
jgi:citrate lyase subunit beta/citryl-CoA lyase